MNTVGLTAGASAPEILVQEAVTFLEEQGFTNMREVEVMPEHVRFGLPPEIVEAIARCIVSGPRRAPILRAMGRRWRSKRSNGRSFRILPKCVSAKSTTSRAV